jgi:DNA-binding XRE family transcriptional regulator
MNKTITIDQSEYDALIEARDSLEDLQAFDRVQSELMAGRAELIPASVLNALLAGENPLRVWRGYRELTQVELSERAKVNRVQIAEIETGKKSGSVETLRKLAVALDLSLDDLAG